MALLLALAPPTSAQTGARLLAAHAVLPAGDVLEVAAASGEFTSG